MLLIVVATGFGQETSKLSGSKRPKSNSDTLNSTVDPRAGTEKRNQATGAPHTTVNSNSGTIIPGTTSGTLNSNVNPNTQLVIPIHKGKRKSNSRVTTDSGIITPNNAPNSSVTTPKTPGTAK